MDTEFQNGVVRNEGEFEKVVQKRLYTKPMQAVIVLNVDNLKFVNHSYVNFKKNMIMNKMIEYVRELFGEEVEFGKINGAEVVLFLGNVKSKQEVIENLDDFVGRAKRGVDTDGNIVRFGISAGVVFVNDADEKSEYAELLENAEIAMQYAMEDDFSSFMIFNESMAAQMERSLAVLKELRDNIQESKFILKFQPLFDVSCGKLIGFEVLSRILSDRFGIISPSEFIGIAEKNNLLCDFDKVIFDLSCQAVRKIVDMGIDGIRYSVNVTPVYVLKPGFIDDVKHTMAKYGIESRHIAFEITENTLFGSFEIIREVVDELNNMGIAVYLDDFGSGFSNFIVLQELKFARIKLDKGLIDKIENDRSNILVKKVIEIIEALGVKSVAEGIESKGQLEELIKLKCDIGQGYYFGKPMSFNQMLDYIEECRSENRLNTGEIV